MPEVIHYTEHAADALAQAAKLIEADEPFALVASVASQGGTARELGSLAVIRPSGEMFGYLSNGCVDRDIVLNGKGAMDTGAARVVHYGEGSPFADLALPCGGMLKVLIDPAPDRDRLRAAHHNLEDRVPARLDFAAPELNEPLAIEYSPKPKLVIAGRGAVFCAMAHIANAAGFELGLLSPDDADLAEIEHLSRQAAVHLRTPDDVPALDLDEWSAFLTLFHDHDWEPHLLRAALDTDARFVGALGSRTTQAMRMHTMSLMGVSEDKLARLKGPIGLVPSLRSAHLIATSAMAELAGVFSRSQYVV